MYHKPKTMAQQNIYPSVHKHPPQHTQTTDTNYITV